MSDQPPGIDPDDPADTPSAHDAAERVAAFVSWFGDGQVHLAVEAPPLYARDLAALVAHAEQHAPYFDPDAPPAHRWTGTPTTPNGA